MTQTKVVVIGGGIAGVSAAYALGQHRSRPSVTLIEAEAQLAQHTTGRSAAQYIENYGTSPTRVLTKASHSFFIEPPEGLADGPLLQPRGMLIVAGTDQSDPFERSLAEGRAQNPTITEITPDEAVALFPYLRGELVERAMLEPDSADIDVAGLHQAFVRGIVRAGGSIDTSERAVDLARADHGWDITTSSGTTLGADIIVNAAGAWGDEVGAMAGLSPLGLRPLRRTAFMVPAPGAEVGREPLVADVEHRWYTKRDGPQYLCSPADETPSEPCDAKPEEIDIARAIDLINAATTMGIRTVRSSWAGLRTFSPDDTMVLGPDPTDSSFVWSVGQGGVGIQTSPAAGRLVADLAIDGEVGTTFDGYEIDVDAFSSERFPNR